MKIIRRILIALVAVVALLAAAVACIWGPEIATIKSVEQVDKDGYLYKMQYKAPYDLDEIIEADIDANAKLLQFVVKKVGKGLPIGPSAKKEESKDFACTSFQARNSEGSGYLYGRNYDYSKNPTIVVESHPKNGYASIAVCDMSHFGYSLDKLPQSLGSKVLTIASVYAPMDGINEKGLCTSIMALPKQASQQSTGKHCVGTTIIMRLFLDRCATVQEALDLVGTLDIRHDAAAGAGYHYMVADANGDCAVIEFDLEDGWKTMIVRKEEGKNWMHVTNHLLSPKYYTTEPDPRLGNPHSMSWWRYKHVAEFLGERDGVVTPQEAVRCLSDVHWKDLRWSDGTVEDTQYSALYDQSALTLSLRPWNDYYTSYDFAL